MIVRSDTTAVGSDGEKKGHLFLTRNGYKILERNYRTRFGEIDVIARHKGDLIFVEIKYRRSSAYGSPGEAVTLTKQRRIAKSALVYLKQNGLSPAAVRFDVLAIGPAPEQYELLPSAFTVPPIYTM